MTLLTIVVRNSSLFDNIFMKVSTVNGGIMAILQRIRRLDVVHAGGERKVAGAGGFGCTDLALHSAGLCKV